MNTSVKKIVGISALGAISLVEMMYLQEASATPANFTGTTQSNPRGGSVQVVITVDGASGVFKITSISTPLQPTGGNSAYSNLAIPTLTREALTAQSAAIVGVTGASQISAAWIASLFSAIATAAAGGSPVGQASATTTPTPSPTPSPVTTTPSSTPTSSTSTSLPPAPVIPKFNFSPYTGSSAGPDLSIYLQQVSAILALIPGGTEDVSASSLIKTRNSLLALQTAMQSAVAGSQTNPTSLATYIPALNLQMTTYVAQTQQTIDSYYLSVQNSAKNLFAKAQASAAALATSPTPKVTATTSAAVQYKLANVIKKTYTCVRTVGGVTTKKVLKSVVVKCPAGYKLLKK